MHDPSNASPQLAPGAWDMPVEVALDAYLDTLEGDSAARAVQLRAVVRSEPLARGCPSLAMLTLADLDALRRHLDVTQAAEAAAVSAALEAFLRWAGARGAHTLDANDVASALGLTARE